MIATIPDDTVTVDLRDLATGDFVEYRKDGVPTLGVVRSNNLLAGFTTESGDRVGYHAVTRAARQVFDAQPGMF